MFATHTIPPSDMYIERISFTFPMLSSITIGSIETIVKYGALLYSKIYNRQPTIGGKVLTDKINNCERQSELDKDYYENLYYICCGTKIITLCPPSDILFLQEQTYISGQFIRDKNNNYEWKVQIDYNTNDNPNTTGSMNEMNTVQWIGGDVLRKSNPLHQKQFPLIQYTNPITIHVKAHEMIYIPSLWLHHVTQLQQNYDCHLSSSNNNNNETIAINYWYEMNFMSPLYTYFHLLQQMKSIQVQEEQT
jgi:peptidyl-lysine (3S)-dioxygenase / protease